MSFGISPVEYIKAVDGTPTGVMMAMVAESDTAITKGTGLIPKIPEVSIAIGTRIAAVALFEITFVSKSEIVLSIRSIVRLNRGEISISAV